MTKQKFSAEQKREYFAELRQEWMARKAAADQDEDAKKRYAAIMEGENGKFSYTSFYFTLIDMRKLGLDGNPYVDTKTFNGWRQAGFKVKKGEKSKIRGIVWMGAKKKDENGKEEEDDIFLYPKAYHLFHRTQVEAI